jgi:predicted porin
VLFGGVSSKQFGTLTVGRQNSLQLDQLVLADPQYLSYAFSFLGYSGFNGGAGSTQAARWDNSVKYVYQNGPVHVAGMYSTGGADIGLLGKAYGANVGITYSGLSVDAVYQNEKGAVNLRSSFDNLGVNPIPTPGLAAYMSNDTSYNLMARYTFEFANATKDKLTVFAGYSHIQKAHGDYEPGVEAEGNYQVDIGININDNAEYNMEWVGARYQVMTNWNLSAAYYHITQNSWTIGLGPTGNNGIGCSAAGLLCAGDFNEVSAVADYVFNKHYDLYAGVNWSEVTDGLANGFVGTTVGTSGSENQVTVMLGARVKF